MHVCLKITMLANNLANQFAILVGRGPFLVSFSTFSWPRFAWTQHSTIAFMFAQTRRTESIQVCLKNTIKVNEILFIIA